MTPTSERAEAIHQRITDVQHNLEQRMERIEADIVRLWERVDRVPAWLTLLFSLLTAVLGTGMGYLLRIIAG